MIELGKFINTNEIASLLGVKRDRAMRLCAQGEFIGAKKDNGNWYAPEESVLIYIKTHSKANTRNREKNRAHIKRLQTKKAANDVARDSVRSE